ncbi:MAG: outer membrane beta-barrel protein [Bryobacteraceae bacterium]|nr:outer membrane beta-barrel protein [Bryobacteraceae bacterium]
MAISIRIPFLLLAAWFVFASAGSGQRLHFGVAGGTNLTSNFPVTDVSTPADAFGNPANRFQYLTGPRSFIFGAMAEVGISEQLSLEANVLHRPLKSQIVFTEFFPDGSNVTTRYQLTAARAWEFPVLLKYTLPSSRQAGRARPFFAAGPSFRTQEDAGAVQPSQFGLSAGAGVALRWGRIHVSPTLRYARWRRESIAPRYATKPDQLEFLTTVSYETDPGSRRVAGRALELGAIVGLPVTRGFHPILGERVPERMRYLAGLVARTKLKGNLSIEVDAIYKPLRAGGDDTHRFSVLTWQFPVLARYSRPVGKWSPFAEAGPSFRLAGNLNGYNPSHYGLTVGGGIEARARDARLSPGIRYTRWAQDPRPSWLPSGVPFNYPRTNTNDLELVLGASF